MNAPATNPEPQTPPAQTPNPPSSDPPRPTVLPPTITIESPGAWLQFRTANRFEYTHASFPVRDLPAELNGIRLLHLSDIHTHGGWDPAFDELIHRTTTNPPDMILFTGDFVDDRYDHRHGLPTVQKLINGLQSRLGTFGILGNHDGDLLAPALFALNITLIDHRQLCLHAGNAILELIGLGGVDRDDLDISFLRGLAIRPPGAFRIVLGHFPDMIKKAKLLQPDLYLSGHTHGGQICLPGGIPIIRHDSLPRQFCTGINPGFGTWMITSRGLGFSSRIKARLFCPAQIIEIQLIKAP